MRRLFLLAFLLSCYYSLPAWAACSASAGDGCSCNGSGNACISGAGVARCNNDDGSFWICFSTEGGTLFGGTSSDAVGGRSSRPRALPPVCKCELCPKGKEPHKGLDALLRSIPQLPPLCEGGSSSAPGGYSQ